MGLPDKIKRLFSRSEVPDETRSLLDGATSTQEVLRGLDGMLTQNEVQAKELEQELSKLERLEQEEVGRVKAGQLSKRQKRGALLHIRRLRKQMENYEARQRIYNHNMDLHLSLISKIQEMEAMKLAGVDEKRIDEIGMEFEESIEGYNETLNAGEALSQRTMSASSAEEERELRELDRELLGATEAPATEAPATEAQATEAPARASAPRDIERDVEQQLAGGAEKREAGGEARVPTGEDIEELERELLEE